LRLIVDDCWANPASKGSVAWLLARQSLRFPTGFQSGVRIGFYAVQEKNFSAVKEPLADL
jgi:hypothetical protein